MAMTAADRHDYSAFLRPSENGGRSLELLVKGATPKATNKLMFKTAGVIPDEFFEPEALKRPNLAK